MDKTVEQRVAAGAAWLDRYHPGWELSIDPAKLNIRSDWQ